ncbi:MAG: hypothetical protein V1857_01100 [archaeon]
MAKNPLPIALMNLFVGAVTIPLLMLRTSSNTRAGLSSPVVFAVAGISMLTSPVLAITGVNIWPIQISIQILLSLFAFKSLGAGTSHVVAFSGLGQTSIVGLVVLHRVAWEILVLAEIALLTACVVSKRLERSRSI